MNDDVKRIRLLKIWELLLRETDEDHPLATEELLKKLRDAGITCVRSTLYQDIKTLQKYGYEIFCRRAKQNEYYVAERGISIPEVLILMDAVQAASFITPQKTKELVAKVSLLAGSERGKVLQQNIVEFTTPKSKNKNIYYAVSEISQAILHKRKITFYYFDYDVSYRQTYRMSKRNPGQKKVYKVNPLGTVFDNGYYYLFCYDDYHNSIVHYRVDRMDALQMIDEACSEIANKKRGELSERKSKLFSMFGGEERKIEFAIDKELIGVIYDKFGTNAKLKGLDGDMIHFSVDVLVSPTFLAWCCSLGKKLKITAPLDVVEQIRVYIKGLSSNYKQ